MYNPNKNNTDAAESLRNEYIAAFIQPDSLVDYENYAIWLEDQLIAVYEAQSLQMTPKQQKEGA